MNVPFFLLHLAEIVFRVENPFCGVMGGGGGNGGGEAAFVVAPKRSPKWTHAE